MPRILTLLLEYSGTYSKTGSLWRYCRDEPNDNITDSKSFKFKLRFLNDTNGTLDI